MLTHTLDNMRNQESKSDKIIKEMAIRVANVLFESIRQIFRVTSKSATDLFSILMEPAFTAPQVDPIDEANRRKRKKNKIE